MQPDPTDRDDNDDPTRALDDFVRRMRTGPAAGGSHGGGTDTDAGANPGLPDLSGLDQRLHGTPAPAGPRRGGVLRSGQAWSADDVVDVPELPRAPPPPADTAALDDSLRQASTQAAALWAQDAAAAAGPVWQPGADRALAQQRQARRDPRLLAQPQADAWVGLLRPVLAARTELSTSAQGPVVDHHAAQALLMLWAPVATGQRSTWPDRVALVAQPLPADDGAALLAHVPAGAPLWLAAQGHDTPGHEAADWALGAELLLLHEPALQAAQLDGLRAFIEAERVARFERLNAGYQRGDDGSVQRRA